MLSRTTQWKSAKRRFTPILMNRRNCNAQYGGMVPLSKWKSQSLIGKVIASLQCLLEAPIHLRNVSALWLCMGWSSLINKLFKHYLSIKPGTHQAVFVRRSTKFSQCVLRRRLKLVLVCFFFSRFDMLNRRRSSSVSRPSDHSDWLFSWRTSARERRRTDVLLMALFYCQMSRAHFCSAKVD